MNGGIDKLADAIKEKVSKKQIISVVGMIAIAWKIEATPEMKTICVTIIVAMSLVSQTILDYFSKGETRNENSNDNDVDVPAG